MASLDDRLGDAVRAHLARSGLSGRRFGARALGDPGFVASQTKGRRCGLATADRVLAAMGARPIGPAFRREVEAFLSAIRTKVYVLGEGSAGAPSFVERLRRGASVRLATVERVRAWMAAHSNEAGRGAAILDLSPRAPWTATACAARVRPITVSGSASSTRLRAPDRARRHQDVLCPRRP